MTNRNPGPSIEDIVDPASVRARLVRERLPSITVLDEGSHKPNGLYCLLEAVAYVSGEPWSDRPETVCPILAAFGRELNDCILDSSRQSLIPLIPRLINSKSTRAVETKRMFFLVDKAARVFVPNSLRAAGLYEEAQRIERLPLIDSLSVVGVYKEFTYLIHRMEVLRHSYAPRSAARAIVAARDATDLVDQEFATDVVAIAIANAVVMVAGLSFQLGGPDAEAMAEDAAIAMWREAIDVFDAAIDIKE